MKNNNQVKIEVNDSRSESRDEQKMRHALMVNVEEGHFPIDVDMIIASTSTSSYSINDIY
jgi:hypothetical protein